MLLSVCAHALKYFFGMDTTAHKHSCFHPSEYRESSHGTEMRKKNLFLCRLRIRSACVHLCVCAGVAFRDSAVAVSPDQRFHISPPTPKGTPPLCQITKKRPCIRTHTSPPSQNAFVRMGSRLFAKRFRLPNKMCPLCSDNPSDLHLLLPTTL